MAMLLVLNGPPGIGKSTLARRYVDDHPLAFCLDVDEIRRRVGRWEDHEPESGALARAMALEVARVHLSGGYDVVVPQYLGRVDLLVQLEALAGDVCASFVEVVLMDTQAKSLRRFEARAEDASAATHHREASRMVGGACGLADMWDRLQEVIAMRSHAVVVQTQHGDVEGAYAALVDAVRRPARS